MFSPYKRAWIEIVQQYLATSAPIESNPPELTSSLLELPIVDPPMSCKDVAHLWPAGTDSAIKLLNRFLYTKASDNVIDTKNQPDIEEAPRDFKNGRLAVYNDKRDKLGIDGSSRLSPVCELHIRQTPRMLKQAFI